MRTCLSRPPSSCAQPIGSAIPETLFDARRNSPRDTRGALAQEQLEQQPEVQAFLRHQSEQHWETWLDTPLPALGTLTPRQAAHTSAGRERLEGCSPSSPGWPGRRHTRWRRTCRRSAPGLDSGSGEIPLARGPDTARRLMVARVAQRLSDR
jgi:hypothetical protein